MLKNMDQKIRSGGIGGSEIGAILGVDSYSSPYQVWLRKTGRDPRNVDNQYTEAGIILEDAVATYFAKRTNYKMPKIHEDKTYVHPKYKFVLGTPDRFYFGKDGSGKGILECKTTQAFIEDPPTNWFCQLQWYLGVMGMNYGSLAWLTRGVFFNFMEYEFDPQFFDYMVDMADDFWHNNVLKDVAPEPINIQDVTKLYAKHIEGKSIPASSEMLAKYEELNKISDSIKTLQERYAELSDEVKIEMKDAEAVIHGTKSLFTWRKPKDSVVFDQYRFRAEHRKLYDKYMMERESSRRFLLK